MISPIIQRGNRAREGKGFSKEELKETGLSPGEAKRLGIPVDTRRKTSYEDNVETLKEYLKEAKEAKIKVSKPKQTGKPVKGRAYRGMTSAGKKVRNLSRRK
jgi:large subunit ribosomal protein L13e